MRFPWLHLHPRGPRHARRRPRPMAHDSTPARTGVSRRNLLKGGAAAGLAAALGAAHAGLASAGVASPARRPDIVPGWAPGDDAPDLVFVNGAIHTMDDAGTVARSVAIRNGR